MEEDKNKPPIEVEVKKKVFKKSKEFISKNNQENNMKKVIIPTAIIAFIVGLIVAVAGYHAYIVYQLRDKVEQQDVVLKQVVDFLNKSIAAQQPKVITPVAVPATTSKKVE